jgi:hypothetical protein
MDGRDKPDHDKLGRQVNGSRNYAILRSLARSFKLSDFS